MEKTKILLGKRIRELREKQGLSQQDLAEMVEIDQRNLSKIECGSVFPSKSLESIAKALKVDLDDLFKFNHINLSHEEKCGYIKSSINKLSHENINIIYKIVVSMLK